MSMKLFNAFVAGVCAAFAAILLPGAEGVVLFFVGVLNLIWAIYQEQTK